MRRREFISVIGGAAWRLAARAQQPDRVRRIGVLMGYAESDRAAQSWLAAFRGALPKLGWTEGSNLRIELRWSANDPDRMRTLAKELVDLRPDAILGATTPVTGALARETKTISIPSPEIATTEALKQAMLSADSIVYNTASSGLYLEKLFERIGIAEQIKAKTTRYSTGEDVMDHIIRGSVNELGFGAITEIKLFEPKGLKLVVPLPPDIQNYTSYGAALISNAPSADAAKAFLTYLATPEAKQIFAAAGIE